MRKKSHINKNSKYVYMISFQKNIKYFIGNAEKLNFESNFFDKYTISKNIVAKL